VTVADDQLSLAIGRDGQNVRLAWKLTGFKIDIVGSGGEVIKEEDLEEIKEGLEKETDETSEEIKKEKEEEPKTTDDEEK
ncbi:MAG: transcription termination/antitermination protein NusA, partial [Candidatus Dojkabacteria bacterium]|nr:transcription termination/antitermination protein NusA [Candidatus Dojkabacteria bacterium]